MSYVGQAKVGLQIKSYFVSTQMKALLQYFPVVLLITLNKVILTFQSVNDNLL